MNVTIWHNIATDPHGRLIAMLDGYSPGHPLVPVAQYIRDDSRSKTSREFAEDAYRLFNIGDDPDFGTPDPIAVQYRQAGNRSLSVGDVVQIGDEWLCCASVGFTPIDEPAWFARNARAHGTTPIEASVILTDRAHRDRVRRPTHEDGIKVAEAIAAERHLDISALRRFASEHLSHTHPDLDEIGTSDVSIHLAVLGNQHPELLREEARRLQKIHP